MEKFTNIAKMFFGLVCKMRDTHQGRFLAGDKVTIADFAMASIFGNFVMNPNCPLKGVCEGMVNGNPKLKAYCDTIMNEMTYLKRRGPIGPF